MKSFVLQTLFAVSQKYESRIATGVPVKGDITREIEHAICSHVLSITPEQRLVINRTVMLFASRLTGDMFDEYSAKLGENMMDCCERILKVIDV